MLLITIKSLIKKGQDTIKNFKDVPTELLKEILKFANGQIFCVLPIWGFA